MNNNKLPKIFVALSSRDEPQLVETIQDCLAKAAHPERVILGISVQAIKNPEPDLSFLDRRHKVIYLDDQTLYGVGHSRYLVSQLFATEDYFFQVDAHTTFVEGWDDQIIDEFLNLQRITGNKKVVISGYTGNELHAVEPRPVYKWVRNPEHRHLDPSIHTKEDSKVSNGLTQFITAHYLFTDKNFVQDFKYPNCFRYLGEEPHLSMEAYTLGYDIYDQAKYAAFHYDRNLRDKDRTIFNSHGNQTQTSMYVEHNHTPVDIFTALLDRNGGQFKPLKLDVRDRPRTVEQFLDFHGIDYNLF